MAIEFVSKTSSRCLTLEQALEAVGFISTGLFTNSFNASADLQAANTQLENLKTFMCLARVV